MIEVSEKLRNLINADSRTFRVKLMNGESTYEEIRTFKKSILFPNSSMSVGNALSACIECTATDVPVSITGAEIEAQITILDRGEWIKLGKFTTEKPTVQDGNVTFMAYDKMTAASNNTYVSTLSEGGHTVQEYFSDICSVLGAECVELPEDIGDLLIEADKLSGYSCRDALAYLAGFIGRNCIVNRDGLFEMIAFTAVEYDMLNADRIAEPELSDSDCVIGYIACCVDSETTLQTGTGSSGFELISPIMTQERLDSIGEDIFGESSDVRVYKSGKITQLLGDPTLEICDVVNLKFGGNVYVIPIMSLVLDYDGGLQAEIESFELSEPNSLTLSERLSFAQKQAQGKTDSYIKAVVEFSEAMQKAYGVSHTEIDGITYFHDSADITEAEYIFCLTTKGLAFTSGANCWGGSHENTVWQYGINKGGEAVLKMLKVFHISADLIEAGILKSVDGNTYFDLGAGEMCTKKESVYTDTDGTTKTESMKTSFSAGRIEFNSSFDDKTYSLTIDPAGMNIDAGEEGGDLSSYVFVKPDGFDSWATWLQNLYKLMHKTQWLWANPKGITISSTKTDTDGNVKKYDTFITGSTTKKMCRDENGNEIAVSEYRADGAKVAAFIPHILPSGTDFDTVRTPNVYVGAVQLGDGTTANYGNSPSVQAAAFLFEVLPTGATNQVIQRLTLCSKGNSRTFERHYHTSSFGNWYCTYSDGNTLLWSGAEQMDADTVIELTEAISKQPNGVVFVFSYFATDGTVGNYQFQSFFKSKHEIKTHPGGGHQFMLCGSNFNTIATKYFYINDLKITGYAGNIKSGTATTGIIYDNNKYVLRYVIGV